MATMPNPLDEALQDFQFPQREGRVFSMASFCAAIPPTNCAATFASPPPFSPSGIANPSASPSFVQFWNASSNIASTFLAIFENLLCHDSTTQRLQ